MSTNVIAWVSDDGEHPVGWGAWHNTVDMPCPYLFTNFDAVMREVWQIGGTRSGIDWTARDRECHHERIPVHARDGNGERAVACTECRVVSTHPDCEIDL